MNRVKTSTDTIQQLLCKQFDIILLQETWLYPGELTWWINHSTPGTIRPPELCYFKHEYEAGVGRRFSCYNRICHDVGGRACGGVSVLVRDGTTHSQITLNTTLHCGLRQLIWCC